MLPYRCLYLQLVSEMPKGWFLQRLFYGIRSSVGILALPFRRKQAVEKMSTPGFSMKQCTPPGKPRYFVCQGFRPMAADH